MPSSSPATPARTCEAEPGVMPPVGPPRSGVFLAPVGALAVDPQRQAPDQEDQRERLAPGVAAHVLHGDGDCDRQRGERGPARAHQPGYQAAEREDGERAEHGRPEQRELHAARPEAQREHHRQPGHELRHDVAVDLEERGARVGDARRVTAEVLRVFRDDRRPVLGDPAGELHVGRRVILDDHELRVEDPVEDAERDRDRHQRPQRPARRRLRPALSGRAPDCRPGHRGNAPPGIGHEQRGERQPKHDHRDGLEVAEQQQQEAGQHERQEHEGGQGGQPPEEKPRGVPGIALHRADAATDRTRLTVDGQ